MKKRVIVLYFYLALAFSFIVFSNNIVSASDALSSNSTSLGEWTMDGRTLDGARYYPGKIPSDISQLPIFSYASTDSTGDVIITNDSVFGIALRTRMYRLNATNISQRLDQTPYQSLFQYPVPAFGIILFMQVMSMEMSFSIMPQT